MDNKLRIGITTRVGQAEGYTEPRDCLAQDWAVFFGRVLPEASWIMLPNIGDDIVKYAQEWSINSFIISGGNDIGDESLRDKTESCLVHFAQEKSMPLLGICRGLQLLASLYGGRIELAKKGSHPATPHPIEFSESPYSCDANMPEQVNSYHNWLVKDCGILEPFAFDRLNNIEGAYDKDRLILGIGWHPERKSPSSKFDKTLIRNFFLKDN